MRRRLTVLACIVLFLALGAYAIYVWFGHRYEVHFDPKNLHLMCTVTGLDRAGGELLTVGFNNRSQRNVVILESKDLGGPFAVVLADAATGKTVKRRPPGEIGAGRKMNVRPRSHHYWNVRLSKLYGKLPPGEYALQVIYDTAAAAERGEPWVEELDLGRTEAPPVRFKVKAPK